MAELTPEPRKPIASGIGELQAHASAIRTLTEARDSLIRVLAEQYGLSSRDLAEHSGLSHSTVARIIRKGNR